jgi:hypothetical protein
MCKASRHGTRKQGTMIHGSALSELLDLSAAKLASLR